MPDVLSVDEMIRLLEAPKVEEPLAWRDRALLELAYGAGLRVSELCALGLTDLLIGDGLVRAYGKGKKERLVPIGRAGRVGGLGVPDDDPPASTREHRRGAGDLNARAANRCRGSVRGHRRSVPSKLDQNA